MTMKKTLKQKALDVRTLVMAAFALAGAMGTTSCQKTIIYNPNAPMMQPGQNNRARAVQNNYGGYVSANEMNRAYVSEPQPNGRYVPNSGGITDHGTQTIVRDAYGNFVRGVGSYSTAGDRYIDGGGKILRGPQVARKTSGPQVAPSTSKPKRSDR